MHLKLRYWENSLANNSLLCCQVIVKLCAEHGSDTAVLCAKFENELTTYQDVMSRRDLSLRCVLDGYHILQQSPDLQYMDTNTLVSLHDGIYRIYGGCCYRLHFYKTHLQLRSREKSFLYYYAPVAQFFTEHISIIAMHCVKFQNDFTKIWISWTNRVSWDMSSKSFRSNILYCNISQVVNDGYHWIG